MYHQIYYNPSLPTVKILLEQCNSEEIENLCMEPYAKSLFWGSFL